VIEEKNILYSIVFLWFGIREEGRRNNVANESFSSTRYTFAYLLECYEIYYIIVV